jgi:tetratricopeptide (TPR) repeat protein
VRSISYPRMRAEGSEPRTSQAETLGGGETSGASGAGAGPGTKLGRYELLDEIGRGGMGIVYRARDPGLSRDCALKVIRVEAASPAQLERFAREARAAARLGRHPNVVPVFEFGDDAGRPFIAMALVHGRPLDRRLAGDGPLVPTAAADIARKVALALDHAHRAGLVHRDVKPSNILIDEAGEPLVTDFGLAKDVTGEAAGASLEGSIIGTPAYMPPEQVEGGAHRIDARADVYSIGAVLYHCLSGRPPFEASSVAATLNRVLHDEAVRPRKLRREIPRDLETIVLKCLEKDPDRRYATAAALAEDLAAFLAGRQIAARPPTIRYVLGLAIRRHRALAATIALAAVVLVAATAYFIERLRVERDRLRIERGRAERRAEIARSVLDTLVFTVRDELGDIPGERLRGARRKLLEEAMRGLGALGAAEAGEEGGGGSRAVETRMQLGDLALAVGDTPRAVTEYAAAMADARGRLRESAPGEGAQLMRQLAFALGKLGHARRLGGDMKGSSAATLESLATVRALVARNPDTEVLRRDLHGALIRAGEVLRGELKFNEAAGLFTEALAIGRAFAATAPGSTDALEEVAMALDGLASCARYRGDAAGSVAAFREVIELRRGLVARVGGTSSRRSLSAGLLDLGDSLRDTGDLEGASAAYTEALAVSQALVADDPGSMPDRRNASLMTERLGDCARARGDPDGALAHYRETLAARREALAHDRNATTLWDVSLALDKIGDLHLNRREAGKARPLYEESLGISRALVALDPTSRVARRDLTVSITKVGQVNEAAKDLDRALELYDEALAIRRALLAESPGEALAQRDLSVTMTIAGRARFTMGDIEAAERLFAEALALSKTQAERNPKSVNARVDLAISWRDLADVHRERKQFAEALAGYERYLAIVRELAVEDPTNVSRRRNITFPLGKIGETYERMGDAARAAEWFEKAVENHREVARLAPSYASEVGQLEATLAKLRAAAAAVTAPAAPGGGASPP